MIPSKHPKCYHPAQSLDSTAFRYQNHLSTDIRQRFARARDDLQRPQFKLVGQPQVSRKACTQASPIPLRTLRAAPARQRFCRQHTPAPTRLRSGIFYNPCAPFIS